MNRIVSFNCFINYGDISYLVTVVLMQLVIVGGIVIIVATNMSHAL